MQPINNKLAASTHHRLPFSTKTHRRIDTRVGVQHTSDRWTLQMLQVLHLGCSDIQGNQTTFLRQQKIYKTVLGSLVRHYICLTHSPGDATYDAALLNYFATYHRILFFFSENERRSKPLWFMNKWKQEDNLPMCKIIEAKCHTAAF